MNDEEVKDWIEAASMHIAKLLQETLEIPGLKAAAEELKEDMKALHTRHTDSSSQLLGSQLGRPFQHRYMLYLQHLAEQARSKSAAEVVNALAWVHGLASVNSPTTSPMVQKTLQGLNRILSKPVQKKRPMTKEMITDILVHKHPSLANIHLATACLLAFSGFLCFDELIHIKPCDITIDAVMAKIHIPCKRWTLAQEFRCLNAPIYFLADEPAQLCSSVSATCRGHLLFAVLVLHRLLEILEYYLNTVGVVLSNYYGWFCQLL